MTIISLGAASILTAAAFGANPRLCLIASSGLSVFVLCNAIVVLCQLRRENAWLRRGLTVALLRFPGLEKSDELCRRSAGRRSRFPRDE